MQRCSGPGNTRQARCKYLNKQKIRNNQMARNYQLTINESTMDKYEEIREYLLELEPNYLYSCIEENKQEKLHMHIYVQYTRSVRLSTKKTKGAHIEVCKGTPQENKNYIDKIKRAYNTNNIIDEMGTMRLAGIKSNLAISLMEKELEEVTISEFKIWKELRGIRTIEKEERHKNVEVIYIYGESGVGKSKKVYDMLEPHEKVDIVKREGGFWLGVNYIKPVKTCWYDDFRDSHMSASEFIHFIDYNINQMSVKYCPGWLNIYEKIYITSIQSPHDIYRNIPEETKTQWLRRMKIIHMEKLN